MNYYLELTLLADGEVNIGFLWQKVYQQIHLILVKNKIGKNDSAIAVSFPEYGAKVFPLGRKLRLLGKTENGLISLNVTKWLARLDDYVHIKAIKPVPDNIEQYAVFTRKQFKSPKKLRAGINARANKIAAKNNYDVEEVKKRLFTSLDKYDKKQTLPFINMISLSSDVSKTFSERKSFKLFIEKQIVVGQPNSTDYLTCYGLSRRDERRQIAVPLF